MDGDKEVPKLLAHTAVVFPACPGYGQFFGKLKKHVDVAQ